MPPTNYEAINQPMYECEPCRVLHDVGEGNRCWSCGRWMKRRMYPILGKYDDTERGKPVEDILG